MGGFGSGRRYGRPVADSAMRIDFAWMLREGLAVPNQVRTGNLHWTRNGEPSGNISYTCDMRDLDAARLELRFTVTQRLTGETRDYVQQVMLSYSVPHFGGKRWWMHCPVNGERVGKLYCPIGSETFASRTAYKIGYQSQRSAKRDKPFEALFRLQKRLGCREGWEQPIRRPKGMWRRTYVRLEQRYWQLDRQCGSEMMGLVEQLRSMK